MNDNHHRRVALIKRPPLVRSSSPATCYKKGMKQKKSVRFCDSLETVRLFLKTDKPKACQSDASSSPTYHLSLPNWPLAQPTNSPIRLEKLHLLSAQLMLEGTCAVANLAFEKHVMIRYTTNDWKTVKQVDAVYREPIDPTCDRFSFKIALDAMHQTLCLAATYHVAGREFWDNNYKKNYTAHIIPDKPFEDASASSSDEDDDHTFEDCCTDEDKHELALLAKFNYHDFKPWSPPLSPTTPVDMNPLWSIHPPIKPIHYMHSTAPLPSLS